MAEKDSLGDFKNFVKSQSIFETKKVVFLENALEVESPDALVGELTPFLKSKDATVVLSEHGKPTKAFSELLKKPALAQEFRQLDGKDWEKFISDIAKKRGVVLDDSALALLARVYAGNSWGLVMEIEKLGFLGKKTSIYVVTKESAVLLETAVHWKIKQRRTEFPLGS